MEFAKINLRHLRDSTGTVRKRRETYGTIRASKALRPHVDRIHSQADQLAGDCMKGRRMTQMLRDRDYWEKLAEGAGSGVLRYVPPDMDIPVPAECDRMAVRRACSRYVVAKGDAAPESENSSMLGLQDRLNYSEFFATTADNSDADGAEGLSVLGNVSMAAFVVAVTGLSLEAYVGVTYEDVVMALNTSANSTKEYIFMVETEYFAATELLYARRRLAEHTAAGAER